MALSNMIDEEEELGIDPQAVSAGPEENEDGGESADADLSVNPKDLPRVPQFETEDELDQEEGDLEKEDYGRRVEKRIKQEIGKRRKLAAQLAEEREARTRMEQQMSEFMKQTRESQIEKAKLQKEQIVEKIQKSTKDMDFNEFPDLISKLVEASLPAQAEPAREAQQADTEKPIPAAAKEWLDANQWYSRQGNRKARRQVAEIEEDLLDEGYDPSEKEMYQELSRRMRQRVKIGSGPTRPSDEPKRGAKTGIPASEKAEMRRYGLDPDDPKVVEAYLRENA